MLNKNIQNVKIIEIFKIIGLSPFFYTMFYGCFYGSVMASIVFFHGVVCHGFYSTPYWIFDMLCNFTLITFVNYTTNWQPHTAIISSLSSLMFFLRPPEQTSPIVNTCIHIFCVQFGLWVCLFNY